MGGMTGADVVGDGVGESVKTRATLVVNICPSILMVIGFASIPAAILLILSLSIPAPAGNLTMAVFFFVVKSNKSSYLPKMGRNPSSCC